MKLFYAPGTCSLAPIILAEWLGLPLELERVNHRDPSPEYLQINPLGAVPALMLDDGSVGTQVDAILQYFLALQPGSGLDGGDDPRDGFEVHRWIAFLTGDFHPPFGGWFNPARYTTDEGDAARAAVKAGFERRIHEVAPVLEEQVTGSGHVALARRTLLDAYAYAMVRWLRKLPGGLDPYPALAAFLGDMERDAGVRRALDRERSGV
ncbi:MAG: glutathione S-transferase family protein [Gammaproteobacteria bacterium]